MKDLLSGEALAEDLALNGNSFAAALATDGTLYIADKDGIYRYEEGLQLLYPLGDDYPFIKYTEWRYPMPVIFVCWWKWTTVRYCLSLKTGQSRRPGKEEITIAFLLRQRALEKASHDLTDKAANII